MHSKPDPPVHDEDDGTWFQPSPARTAAGAPGTEIPRTHAAPDEQGAGILGRGVDDPAENQTEAPTGRLTEGLTGFATQPNGDGGVNAFPTADSKGMGSDPGSGSGLGTSSRESGDWDSAPPPTIQKGLVVFGKYHLLDMIGEGGMGQVWKVRHVELDSDRALKLIKPEIAKNAEGWKRFRREARVMDRLGQHPNSVAIYDFKRVQSMAYIEMGFVRGQSLDKILKDNGGRPMPLPWIVSVLRQLCSVLQEAHSHVDEATGRPKPIVHRDLKPSNLMLVDNKPEGQNLKVLDFGIAKMVDDKGAEDERTMELTGAAVFLGTAGYASPEQIRGDKEIDGRSDLYSTGVMLYQFLTGELPFHGSRMAMLAAHMMRAPAPMTETNSQANVPPAIEAVVLRCLSKDPDERYQTAAELFAAFSGAAGLDCEPTERIQTIRQKPDWKAEPKPKAKKSSWPIAAAAVLLIGLIGGGGAYYWRFKPQTRTTTEVGSTKDPGGTITKTATPTPKVPDKILPEGYVAIPEAQFDKDRYPKALFRTEDSIQFKRISEIAYIPKNYAPESTSFHDWPEVIVRNPGNVRFIHIPDKEYFQGDPRALKPKGADANPGGDAAVEAEADLQGYACTPHRVKVMAFYIQETEVTNGEIDDYLSGPGQKEKQDFEKWRESFELLVDSLKDRKAARLFPAVCVDYNAARKYARAIGGRLPTEAEWELAAKSQLSHRLHSWELATPDDNVQKAHLSYRTATPARLPVKVKSYPEDKTEQNAFDMTGNVREWTIDAYRPYAEILQEHRVDPQTPFVDNASKVGEIPEGREPMYVVRGGSFRTELSEATTFQRNAEPPDLAVIDIGFRVVISCPKLDLRQTERAALAPR